MNSIAHYVTKKPIQVPVDTTVFRAVEIMRQKNIGAILIHDKKGKVQGIFTERDFLQKVDFSSPRKTKALKVKDVMTGNLITVDHDQDVRVVMHLMHKNNIRHLPVLKSGKVIGVISLREVMRRYSPPNVRPISDYMNNNLIVVEEATPIPEVIQLMSDKKVGAVLVRDVRQKTVGIFTERDLLNKVDYSNPRNLEKLLICQVMTPKLITVDQKEGYDKVLELMKERNIRHLPVTEDGIVVGMVSLRDMMRRYEENLELLLAKKETQLVEQYAALKISEERFRSVFNNSAVAIILADQEGQIVSWNPVFARLMDMGEKDLLRRPVNTLFSPSEWKKIQTQRARKKDLELHIETQVINKSGDQVDVNLSASPFKDAEGKTSGFICVMRDISQRKRAEEKMHEYRREIEDIKFGLDKHGIVAVADKDGKIFYINTKFCQTSHFSADEILKQKRHILETDYFSKSAFAKIWRLVTKGEIWHGEVRFSCKDKGFYWVDMTLVPFLNEEGEPYQFVSIQTDITDRKNMENDLLITNRDLASNARVLHEMVLARDKMNEQLRQAQRQIIQIEKMATLGTLAAGFAHEIKNPLAIILQGMECIEKIISQTGNEDNQKYANIIKSAALRANSVVTSILKFSRSSQTEIKLFNLYEVIDGAVELIQKEAQFKGIEFQKNFESGKADVFGDKIMIQQVFFDLFSNAVDAIGKDGKISIKVRQKLPTKKEEPLVYHIEVTDTGAGIDEAHLSKIFDPFFTTKDEGKGTGLGLSTVYLILERHDGKITVKSRMGHGTTFYIELPKEGANEVERRRTYGGQN